jgi:Zn-dependent protease with chaperone function
VTVGAALILYAALVGFAGPAGFRRATWALRAPRLGAAAVVAAAWSVPVALVLAGVTVFLPASGLTVDVVHLVGACLGRLRAAYGTPAGAGIATAGQVLTAGMLLRGAWAVAQVVRRRRAERRRHRLLLRWAGADLPDGPAVVLEQAEAAAYAVAGRRRTVVVTRGIVELLSGPELSAVLAHEHAHLAARHHRWLTAAALVAQALPMVPLLRDAPACVGRLLEMEADELAAAHHEPRVIASALVAVATAGSKTAASPAVSPAASPAASPAVSPAASPAVSSAALAAASPAVPAARPPSFVGVAPRVTSMGNWAGSAASPTADSRAAARSAVRGRALGNRPASGARALGAGLSPGGSEALARVQRLLHPPARLPAVRRVVARTAIAALTLTPLLLAAAPIAYALT